MIIVFKVEREEALYLYNKVKRDYEKAYQANTENIGRLRRQLTFCKFNYS